jgi:hypothetical protein
MIKSESIKELLTALAKAQGKISAAKKDSTNPHFKSKYSDLASCWDAIREPLSSNGLSLSQWVSTSEKGINLVTMLGHSSGEWITSEANFPVKDPSNPQAVGSSLSYARRYCLSAAISLVSDDDDGNAGAQEKAQAPVFVPKKPAKINDEQISDLLGRAAALNVTEAQLVASDHLKRPLVEWDLPAYVKAKAQLEAKETNLRIAKEQAELAKG